MKCILHHKSYSQVLKRKKKLHFFCTYIPYVNKHHLQHLQKSNKNIEYVQIKITVSMSSLNKWIYKTPVYSLAVCVCGSL